MKYVFEHDGRYYYNQGNAHAIPTWFMNANFNII